MSFIRATREGGPGCPSSLHLRMWRGKSGIRQEWSHLTHDDPLAADPASTADTVAYRRSRHAGRRSSRSAITAARPRGLGLDLRDTKLVIFGSPSAATPVPEAAPLVALDLPLRVVV